MSKLDEPSSVRKRPCFKCLIMYVRMSNNYCTSGISVNRWRLEDMGYVMSGAVKNTTPAKTLTVFNSNVTFQSTNNCNLSWRCSASGSNRAIWPTSNDVVASYDPLSTGDVYRMTDQATTMTFPPGVTAISLLIDCETMVNGTATVLTNSSNFTSMPLNTSNSQGPPWGHWVGFYSTTTDYIKSLSWNNNNNTLTDFVDLQLSQSPPNSNTVWETPAATASNEYPPISLVNYNKNTVKGTTGARDGVYTLSSSTMSKPNSFAFDKRMRTEWASIPGAYNSTTGSNLLGVTTQEASNVGINPWIGQWIQVSLPSNVALTSYTISPPAVLGHCPTDWSLVGTTDGLDGWKALSLQSNVIWTDSNPKRFTLTGFNPCFKSYRMVIPNTQTGNTDGRAAIGELKLFSGTASITAPFSSFGRTGTLGTIWGPSSNTVTNANSTAVTTWSTSGGPTGTTLTGTSGTGCTLNVPYGGYSTSNFNILVTADGSVSTYALSVGYSNTYIPPTYAFGTVWTTNSHAISQANVSTGNVTWGISSNAGISGMTITGSSNAGSILNIPYIPHNNSNAVPYSNIIVTATGANNVASTETCSISMGASTSISGSNYATIWNATSYTISQPNIDTGTVTWGISSNAGIRTMELTITEASNLSCTLNTPYFTVPSQSNAVPYNIYISAKGANGLGSNAWFNINMGASASISDINWGTHTATTTTTINQINIDTGPVTWAISNNGGLTGALITGYTNATCTLSTPYQLGAYTLVLTAMGTNNVVSTANCSILFLSPGALIPIDDMGYV